jgi:hypothetical protein
MSGRFEGEDLRFSSGKDEDDDEGATIVALALRGKGQGERTQTVESPEAGVVL